VEVGVKYRFIQENGHRPQVGVFPQLELPTGSAARGLGNGQVWARLPVWAQKSWGPWTSYGGGGYAVNRAPEMQSHAFGGWLLQRDFGKRLTLGGEIYSEGRNSIRFAPQPSLISAAITISARTSAYCSAWGETSAAARTPSPTLASIGRGVATLKRSPKSSHPI
jgi:hypothetical protein